MKNHSVVICIIGKITRSSLRMQSKIFFFLSIILLLPASLVAQKMLSAPQKIVIDSKHGRLLISNYNTGDIVQMDNFGHNQGYFVKTADFVDGMEIVGDTVYGAGRSRNIRAYDLNTNQMVMNVSMPGQFSEYLSSITSDSCGHLFISCPELNTIYKFRISDQTYWVFAKDNGLDRPNGILLEKEKNRIVVIDDCPSPSKIHAISLADSSVSTLTTTFFNRPDGIVRDKNGYYYVGGYYLPGIYKFDPAFSQPPILFYSNGNNFVYPTYDPVDNSLLVTLYENNSWKRISLITNVEETKKLPKNFSLYQNYPNPFNPSTILKYELRSESHVKISVTNFLGETISELVNGIQNAGVHEYQFNTKNLSSGVYYYQITVDGYVETKKMVLMK